MNHAESNITKAIAHIGRGEVDIAVQALKSEKITGELSWIADLVMHTACPVAFGSKDEVDHYYDRTVEFLHNFKPSGTLSGNSIPALVPPAPFGWNYLGRPEIDLRRGYAKILERVIKPIGHRVRKNSRPKVGFVITSGHEAAFTRHMSEVLAGFSDQNFEIVILCSKSGRCLIEPTVGNSSLTWMTFTGDFASYMQAVSDQGFALLYYFEIGTDSVNYSMPFMDAAAHQCTSFGLPVTSGIKAVDYFISSRQLETGLFRSLYTESVALLDCMPSVKASYAPMSPKTRKDFGFSEMQRLYFCPQNPIKIHPAFDDLIGGILGRDPDGVVACVVPATSQAGDLIKSRFSRRFAGLENRLIILKTMSPFDLNTLMKCSDVILDTPGYSGMNTTYDALALGKCVITLPGPLHRSRYTAACYETMGVNSCIASSDADYIELSVNIGRSAEMRRTLEDEITEKSQLLFDCSKTVAETEKSITMIVNS